MTTPSLDDLARELELGRDHDEHLQFLRLEARVAWMRSLGVLRATFEDGSTLLLGPAPRHPTTIPAPAPGSKSMPPPDGAEAHHSRSSAPTGAAFAERYAYGASARVVR